MLNTQNLYAIFPHFKNLFISSDLTFYVLDNYCQLVPKNGCHFENLSSIKIAKLHKQLEQFSPATGIKNNQKSKNSRYTREFWSKIPTSNWFLNNYCTFKHFFSLHNSRFSHIQFIFVFLWKVWRLIIFVLNLVSFFLLTTLCLGCFLVGQVISVLRKTCKLRFILFQSGR